MVRLMMKLWLILLVGLSSHFTVSFTFNSDNQQTSGGTFVYDGNGNPTTYKSSTFAFDPENRVTAIGSTWTAGYRGDGLRGWKQNGSTRTYYLYDGGEPVVELDGSGNVQAINVFAPDGLVARKQSGVWTQYAFDQQGNVAQRLDSSASVTSSSIYDAYGVESTTGTPTDPFGYNARWGYLLDRDTGLYLCQHRYYDAAAGRWVNRDPIGRIGGINLYSMCKQKPNMRIDPLGLFDPTDFVVPPLSEPWTPPFNPIEDDDMCAGRHPRPAGIGVGGLTLMAACAACMSANGILNDADIGDSDKEDHFIAGCLAKLRCGAVCPNTVGSMKELSDRIFGGGRKIVSQADALATDDGYDYAESYLDGLNGGEFGLNDIAFCKYGAEHSVWGTHILSSAKKLK
jgi:RHS repeat-associated protein